jgi:hypothetical protein
MRKKKKKQPTDPNEVAFQVEPGKNYDAAVGKGQHLKLILNQENGRAWTVDQRPSDGLIEERPEGKEDPDPDSEEWNYWLYFTPQENVAGEGDIVLKTTTEWGPDGNADFSKGQTCLVHVRVNTK